MRRRLHIITILSLTVTILISCHSEKTARTYVAENVIVVVIDGPRYSETWGHPTHKFIPNMSQSMAPEGFVCTNFRNEGPTYTSAGHTSILTGVYQKIDNGGGEYPKNPNFLQAYRKKTGVDETKCRIIASKDKIKALGNTKSISWQDKYLPSFDCGINGLGTGYRHDSITHQRIMSYLESDHPNMLFINYREPDHSGHQNNWENYLEGIRNTDEYVYEIFQFIQSDPFYLDKTAFFVTNDHGRHLDEVGSGFMSHGDDCEGCRHINLFAYGPDFKQNVISSAVREQIDLTSTISELMGLNMKKANGDVIWEMFAE